MESLVTFARYLRLTCPPPAQSIVPMFGFTANFYARWRRQAGLVPALRDGPAARPPERLLQAIWQHQRLLRDRLRTADGQLVSVLHPGFRNAEAGPDFRDAVIQFGDEPPRSGDVEIDLEASGWQAHHHAGNPAYAKVLLHVTWAATGAATPALPTLPLADALDAPLTELAVCLGSEGAPPLPERFLGRCESPLRDLSSAETAELLRQAAQVRLESKAAAFRARARQAGWEQALWEGLFRALGYKKNVWPMLRLAELRDRWQTPDATALTLQSRLLGVGGLLPAELTGKPAAVTDYVRRIWDHWWRERDGFADCVLPRMAWDFANLRPANNPQRRLALASHWLAGGGLPGRLERWLAADLVGPAAEHGLSETFQVGEDEFWSWHWTLGSARMAKAQPLVGAQRVTDLAVNVVLPWLWSRAAEGGEETLRQRVERRYFDWPAAEDNSRLKLARQRVLGGAHRDVMRGAAAQQGLMQILSDFCDHSDSVCGQCRFPQLVRDWRAAGPEARALTGRAE